jgi:hypothetical protein
LAPLREIEFDIRLINNELTPTAASRQGAKNAKDTKTMGYLLVAGRRKSFQFMNLSKSEIEISALKPFLAS